MKKITNILFATALAALAMVSCQKSVKEENVIENEGIESPIHFYAENITTKTAFGALSAGQYPTLWTANDTQVKLQQNLAAPVNASVSPSVDFTTAVFTPASPIKSDGSGSYTFYAVSPASAFSSFSTTYKDWTLNVAASQTPSASSVDESTQLLAATSSTTSDFPSSVGFSFKHLTAYGLISLSNFTPEVGETVSSIALTSSVEWVGRWYWYPADFESHSAGEWVATASSSNTITINTSSYTNVWFACVPVDLGGKNIDVVVTTNKGTYSKTITIPSGKKFEAGKIATFSINMSGITRVSPVVYNLITDPDELTVGSKVIIVANGATNADYAAGAQSGSLRGAAAVTKTGSTIISPSASVSVFTLGRGSGANFYSFAESTNYLTAPGGGNNVNVSATLDDASTWKIDFSGSSPAISSTSTTATQVNLRYNYNSGNPRFTCYASGQDDIALYKLEGSGDDDDIITYIDIPSTLAATVGTPADLEALTNSSATIVYESSDPTVATVSSSGTVNPIKAGSCNITAKVSANGSYQAVTTVCAVTVSAPETWQETSLSSIGASDIFVIVGNNGTDNYAMANNGGTSNDPTCIAVTISAGKISGAVTNDMKWKLTGDSTAGYTFLLYNDASKWLYCNTTATSKSNNNLRVGTGDRKVFTYVDNKLSTKDGYTQRNIGFNGTTSFRGYVAAQSATFKFYVLQTP